MLDVLRFLDLLQIGVEPAGNRRAKRPDRFGSLLASS